MERITEKNKLDMTTIERFAAMKIILTKCNDCLGCNRLEDMTFPGDKACKNYRQGMTQYDEQFILARMGDKRYETGI